MATSSATSECKEVSLLLLGKTGLGKSSTGNTILGRPAFNIIDSPYSNTDLVTLESSERREDGTRIYVVDTPGVSFTEKRSDCILPKICEAMNLCPNGVNALIYVVKFGMRYTKEELESLKIVKEYFGSRFLKDYGIIVMTSGDCFDVIHEEDNTTFKDWLEKQGPDDILTSLLKECNNRCVLFYNCGKQFEAERKRCVDELLNLIRTEIPTPYISVHIELAKIMREIELKINEKPNLHTSILNNLSLLIEKIHAEIGSNTFSYEEMNKQLDDLEKEVDSMGENLNESSDFNLLEEYVSSVMRKLQGIFSLVEREKQIAEQQDLQTLMRTPDKKMMYLSRFVYICTCILKPVGTIATVGIFKETLNNWKTIYKNVYDEEVAEYNQRVSEYYKAKTRLAEHRRLKLN